ncbi:MAG: hypothetical protein U0572_06670 [Phycisphaerales bacterium]
MICRLNRAGVQRGASRALSVLVVLACAACSDTKDPRAAKIEVQSAPPAAVVEKAKDPRFDEFRALCRKELAATNALSAFRKSVGKRTLTPDEVGTFDELMGAVKPFAEGVTTWFERPDMTEKDRETLRYIHDVEIPNEQAGKDAASPKP